MSDAARTLPDAGVVVRALVVPVLAGFCGARLALSVTADVWPDAASVRAGAAAAVGLADGVSARAGSPVVAAAMITPPAAMKASVPRRRALRADRGSGCLASTIASFFDR